MVAVGVCSTITQRSGLPWYSEGCFIASTLAVNPHMADTRMRSTKGLPGRP